MRDPDVRKILLFFLLWTFSVANPIARCADTPKPKPKVLVIGVNGMEWDILRPLVLEGRLPNLAHVIQNGTYGKLRTVSAPKISRSIAARI